MHDANSETPNAPAAAPADAGTPENKWLELLDNRPEWEPQNGPLIVVSPHPDEEVLAAGGLIHSWAAAGRAVTIVSVTDGEAAFPRWDGLDLVRREELKGALRKLSPTHVDVIRIGLPDGKVSQFENRVRNSLLALIEPAITLIAPYERDGHCDYDAVGKICIALARSHGIALARYPVWAWHYSDPGSFADTRWGRYVLSLEARRAKARAVQCFASQLHPPRAQPAVTNQVLSHFERPYEAFIL
ncbi:MAG TPA: PIG-L family deacetylase [Steroidobacteraceae bacterium]|nr:PIG-L family deacetylase [Steroidobacteraceae bacterium]